MKDQPNKQLSDDEIDLGNFYRELRMRWYYFVVALVFFFLSALIYIRLTLPTFEATSSILIEDTKSSPKNIEDILSSDLFGANLNLPTEIGILKSRTVALEVVKQLGLNIEYYHTQSFPPSPIYPDYPFRIELKNINEKLYDEEFEVKITDNNSCIISLHYDEGEIPDINFEQALRFNETVSTEQFTFNVISAANTVKLQAGENYIFKIRSSNALVNEIIEDLKIDPLEKDANIVQLKYKDKVASRSVDVLNAISKVYIDLDVQDKAAVAGLTLRFVDEQLTNTGQALSNNEQEMLTFKEKNKTINLSEESKAVLQKLNDLDVERVKNDIQLSSLNNLQQYVSSQTDLTNLAPSSLGIPDPLLVELIQGYQELVAKRKSLAYGVKDNAPSLKIIDEQIAEVKKSLAENISSIKSKLTDNSKSLQQQLGIFENEIKRVPEIERELLGIQRKFEVNQNIYLYLLQKKAETSIAKATAVSDNKILDVAALADEPVWPNKPLLFGLVMLFSVLVPAIYILTKSLLRNTIHSKEDIARLTKIPVLGVIGHSSEGHNLVVTNKPKSVIAESFRSIRTNLRFFGIHQQNKIVLITSSVGGEGKSFVTLNLATVFALQQYKVCVVGLDLRKPRLFQDVGLRNDIGVSNYLIGAASLDQIIKQTSNENLDMIPAGPVPPNPSELISRKEIKQFFDELGERYDYIFVDTPPVGIVSDALILMQYSHINIYIVRQNFSRYEYIRSLNDLMKEGRFSNLSILLNDADYGYSYGYGYGYGYVNGKNGYYEDGEAKNNLLSRIFKKKAEKHHLN